MNVVRDAGRSAGSIDADVAVIGGGPSGAVAAALLASWGRRVCLLTRPVEAGRSLANSLPPSTRKLLEQTDILDLVDSVGYRTTGNTVWWGDRAGRIEPFDPDGTSWGYQVERAQLDPLLLDRAAARGAVVSRDARVRGVSVDVDCGDAVVHFDQQGQARALRACMLLDCSGRAGLIARQLRLRRHVPGGRMQALIGVWRRPARWTLDHPSHTFIETCDEGWAWSIPVSDEVRHVGLMIDGATSRLPRGPSVVSTYRNQLARTSRLAAQVQGASLEHAFACDASVYGSIESAGPHFLLVGDAGSTLNPLSSFGVKKALASAWLAAVVAHTALAHPERTQAAGEFFSRWEQQVWRTNLQRSRDFAREALARHPGPFWETQASLVVDAGGAADDRSRVQLPEVRAALALLRASNAPMLSRGTRPLSEAPIVRGNTIAIEPAAPCVGDAVPLRYFRGVDLVSLTALADGVSDVPALFDRYCVRHAAVALPDFLAALSLLVASDVIVARIS